MKEFLKTKSVLIGLIMLISSCTVEPKKINYGNEHCSHCDMTVVDKTHAAEYVTKKGKTYVFDAIECLVIKLNEEQNEAAMAFILVADFSNPSVLIDAKSATYFICEKIKSPMGANLSAFSSKEKAEKMMNDYGGEVFSWEEIKQKIANKK